MNQAEKEQVKKILVAGVLMIIFTLVGSLIIIDFVSRIACDNFCDMKGYDYCKQSNLRSYYCMKEFTFTISGHDTEMLLHEIYYLANNGTWVISSAYEEPKPVSTRGLS